MDSDLKLYDVTPGETLASIAEAHGADLDVMLEINPNITDPNEELTVAQVWLPGDSEPQPGPGPSDKSGKVRALIIAWPLVPERVMPSTAYMGRQFTPLYVPHGGHQDA
jgi:hypothetical protein